MRVETISQKQDYSPDPKYILYILTLKESSLIHHIFPFQVWIIRASINFTVGPEWTRSKLYEYIAQKSSALEFSSQHINLMLKFFMDQLKYDMQEGPNIS